MLNSFLFLDISVMENEFSNSYLLSPPVKFRCDDQAGAPEKVEGTHGASEWHRGAQSAP